MSAFSRLVALPFSTNKDAGASLANMLMGVAVGSIAMLGAYKVYENFVEQSWYQETKADAMESRDLVARLIKKEFPAAIPKFTASDASTNPDVWTCRSGGPCVLTNGTTLRLTATCQSIASTPLAGFDFTQSANYPQSGAKCAQCSAGSRPVLRVELTKNGNVRTWQLPDPANVKTKGLVGMGLCFAATNSGTVASPTLTRGQYRSRLWFSRAIRARAGVVTSSTR